MKKNILILMMALLLTMTLIIPAASAENGILSALDALHAYQEAQQAANEAASHEGEDITVTISSLDDLIAFRDLVAAGFVAANAVLEADIDLSGIEYWEGINAYNGVFEGNGHTISGLNGMDPSARRAGLFWRTDFDCIIRNLNMTDVEVTGTMYVGAIAGECRGLVENCTATGVVSGIGDASIGGIVGLGTNVVGCSSEVTVSGTGYAGGIVGEVSAGNVESCINRGDVVTTGYTAGGIVGYLSSCTVSNCLNYGSVKAYDAAGGVIGFAKQSDIDRCGNEGCVEGMIYAGGIVGETSQKSKQHCMITNSFNHGDVSASIPPEGAKTDAPFTAGLIGCCTRADLANCYNTGRVSGASVVFALIGKTSSSDPTLFNCYNAGEMNAPYAFAIGHVYTHDIENIYFLSGAEYITDDYTEPEWIATYGKDASAFTDGTVLAALQNYLTSGESSYGNISALCGWVQGEKGPALDWE